MRVTMKLLRVVVLIPLLASSGIAQNTPPMPWKTDTLQSDRLLEQRTVFVSLPDGYATSPERYPVLILLDASSGMRTTTRSTFIMARIPAPDRVL